MSMSITHYLILGSVLYVLFVILRFFWRLLTGRGRKGRNEQAVDGAHLGVEALIQQYGRVLEQTAGQVLTDASKLPAPKDRVRAALFEQIRSTRDAAVRNALCAGYLELHRFQPGAAAAMAAARGTQSRTGNTELDKLMEVAAEITAEFPPGFAEVVAAELQQLRKDVAGYC